MRRFRIGNNIQVNWNVKKNGVDADFSNKTVKVFMTHPRGREEVDDVTVNGSVVSFTFPGLKQSVLGSYTLTVDARYEDGERYLIKDKCAAFCLVGHSCAENDEDTDYVVDL